MKPFPPLCPKFVRFQGFVSSIPNFAASPQNPILVVKLLEKALDQYPDIKTLKKVHSKIFSLRYNADPSLGIKLIRAYKACGEPGLARKVFDKIPEKDVVVYNVWIISYVNNHWYNDALLVFKTMINGGLRPDNYTYPFVLKACSRSYNLRFGLQLRGAGKKVQLDSYLSVGNGLIAMYGKCDYLREARQVLDEMSVQNVISWSSMVAGYATNMRLDNALEICWEMEASGQQPNAATMASLTPAVTNTSSNNVTYVKEMFMNLEKKCMISWNVMITVYVKNSLPAKLLIYIYKWKKVGWKPMISLVLLSLELVGIFQHYR